MEEHNCNLEPSINRYLNLDKKFDFLVKIVYQGCLSGLGDPSEVVIWFSDQGKEEST